MAIKHHTHKHYNIFIALFALALFVGGVYIYFSQELRVEADTPLSAGSALSSSSGSPSLLGAGNNKIAEDTAFLLTLTSLNKLKINTSIFSNQVFNSLKDNTVNIEQGMIGRPNPFAPIGFSDFTPTAAPAAVVTTNEATEITTKSAVLNGAVLDPTGITSTYFEYGLSPGALDKLTIPAKQSLIGTFVTNLGGLKSSTAYFYRAAAKINGTLRYGEVLSFTTN